jgi:DNA-binding beta-propeller fold protein YncE
VLVGSDFVTTDYNNSRVVKINASTGANDGSFGTLPLGASWYIVRGIATNSNQSRVAVANAGDGTVYVFDSLGTLVRPLHSTPGTSAAALSYPEGAAFDASGNVWVADTQNHRVVEFSGTDRREVVGQFRQSVLPDGYLD